MSGTVTATNGGQPLPGLRVSINGSAPAPTNGNGAFTLILPPSALSHRVELTGSGIVERETTVNVTANSDMALDAIRLDGTFDLAFYRKLVRNAHESLTGYLQPIRRFSVAPRIYLRTVDDRGTPISAQTLEQTAAALINGVGEMTGTFGLAGLEMGTGSRETQRGWLTVYWLTEVDRGLCGYATIGAEGGALNLYYRSPNCGCQNFEMAPFIIKHELGHALGFYHTGVKGELMAGGSWNYSQCQQGMTARERYHAAIAYSRPVGNTDPDVDPVH